jgi:hypothetical protein
MMVMVMVMANCRRRRRRRRRRWRQGGLVSYLQLVHHLPGRGCSTQGLRGHRWMTAASTHPGCHFDGSGSDLRRRRSCFLPQQKKKRRRRRRRAAHLHPSY